MKLWQKEYKLDKEVEKFTVGNDFLLDKNLVKYDVYGTLAHANMLLKIKILDKNEFLKLKIALKQILQLDEKNKFEIRQEDEDVHTAIENYLTEKLGSLGKKIHTARSRNDQVLVDLRIYSKENLLEVQKLVLELADLLADSAEKYKGVSMPGYTHSRKAMPSSVGLYFGSFAESLLDDFKLLEEAYSQNDQCPLGSGAGYGIPLEIDRQFVSDLLGFIKVQNNVLYVQNSRGKVETLIVFALSALMSDLAKLANDLITFSMDEFGYFNLPDEFCTGSSIMPQKKNPDVLEIIRCKSSKVDSNLFLIKSITSKLPSGYNRDFQLTKEPLMESFEIALSTLKIMKMLVHKIEINAKKCISSCTPELFATEQAYGLVKNGMPFRDAYKKIAMGAVKLQKYDAVKNILSKKHIGAVGNLGLEAIQQNIKALDNELDSKIKKFKAKLNKLLT